MAIQQEIGRLGESIAVKHLKNKGYSIITQNHWKKWGEIDIVAKKDGILHFVEVKSVSYVTSSNTVSHACLSGRQENPAFDPQDHMNTEKKRRLHKVIETYISHEGIESEYQVDLILVYLNHETKTAKVDFIENIEL